MPSTLIGRVVAEFTAKAEQGVFVSHDQGVVRVPGIDGDAVALLVRTVEKLGEVAHLLPGFRRREVISVFRLEIGHFLRVFEPVLAVCPPGCVALDRNCPVFLAALRILGIGCDRSGRHAFGYAVLGEEVGEIDVVAPCGAGAEPLRVADHHVVGVALGVEFRKSLCLEIVPRRRLNRDLDAGLGRVFVDEFLQVVGRIPFRPENGEFLRERRSGVGKR